MLEILGAFMGGFLFVYWIIFILYFIAIVAANFILYQKAGVPGIFSCIPIVNIIFMAKIAQIPVISIILMFIPFANIPYYFYLAYKFIDAYDGDMVLFLLYVFVTPIAVMYMAFNDDIEYVYDDIM